MDNAIIEKYNSGISATQLAKENNTYAQKIINFLKKNGILIRNESQAQMKYKIDSNMFEKIDSNEKAYFLGWLFSDGNVYLGAKRFTISLTLVESDKCVLDYLNSKIYSPLKKLAYKKERIKFSKGKEYLCKPCYKLQIDNKKMCSDLISLGCVPQKSKTLRLPTFDMVPESFFPHFLRGYFDGDGCAIKPSNKQKTGVFIFSSRDFCLELQKFLTERLDIQCSFSVGRGCCKVSLCSKLSVLKFYNYIYEGGGFSLERKKKKIELGLNMALSDFRPIEATTCLPL